MVYINKVLRAAHSCELPPVAGLDVGTEWACDGCELTWGIKWCQGAGPYLAWRGTRAGKFLPFWHPDRLPPQRQEALVGA